MMYLPSTWLVALSLPLLWPLAAAAGASQPDAADADSTRQGFVAALQRIRLNLPDTPDSPALEAYAIHDYLIAARFRRDLTSKPDDALDTAIDVFLKAHAGQPVTRSLRRDWLASLAQRRRWDRVPPRSADAADPVAVCG